MTKWLLLAVVLVAVLWWLGRGRRSGGGADSGSAAGSSGKNVSGTSRARGPAVTPQPMVACAHCGVWLPKADAVGDASATSPDVHLYCTEAHRRAGPVGD